MTRGDEIVEKGADRLQELANRMAAEGGMKAKFADELADDAAFLRKLKPSLIAERVRGAAASEPRSEPSLAAPSGPQLGPRPATSGAGPNPFVVVAGAFALGILLAKLIDWRGHAHPRD